MQTISLKTSFLSKLLSSKSACLGLSLISLIVFLAIFAPIFSGYTYYDIDLNMKNSPPSLKHFFGTDDLGRDLFTRVWYGARISLAIGLLAALIDVFVGVIWGSTAAYFGGFVETVLMGIANILYSIPYLLIVIVLSLILGSGFLSILAALTILGWISMARIIRGHVKLLIEEQFVLAAITMGANFPRIFYTHLIPNSMGLIIVTLTATIPSAIFSEAFLSFLGLGIQAPLASWGSMAYDGLPAIKYYPWRLFFPSLTIAVTMLSFNLIGDSLAEMFDVKESAL